MNAIARLSCTFRELFLAAKKHQKTLKVHDEFANAFHFFCVFLCSFVAKIKLLKVHDRRAIASQFFYVFAPCCGQN